MVHLKVFAIAAAFGLTAYGAMMGFGFVLRLLGL